MSRSMTKYPMFKKYKSRGPEGKKRNQELNAYLNQYMKNEIDLELEEDFQFKQCSKLTVKPVMIWDYVEITNSIITRKLRKPYATVTVNKPLKKFRIRKSLKRLPDERKIADNDWIKDLFFPIEADDLHFHQYKLNHINRVNTKACKYGYDKPELTKAQLMKLYDNLLYTYRESSYIYKNYNEELKAVPQLCHMLLKNQWIRIFISRISQEQSGILKLHKYKKAILKQIIKAHNDLYQDYLKANREANRELSSIPKQEIYKYYIK